MGLTTQIARHFREIHFGGNWTCSNLRDNLTDITWQQATTQVHSLNTIAALVYHVNYYVGAVLEVFKGELLDAHDKYSFDHPAILSAEDWEKLRDKTLAEAEELAVLIDGLPEHRLWENLADEKYGNYYRNIHGIIEHTHYHLGQIAVIKKIIKDLER
jgi:hypothetical protein